MVLRVKPTVGCCAREDAMISYELQVVGCGVSKDMCSKRAEALSSQNT